MQRIRERIAGWRMEAALFAATLGTIWLLNTFYHINATQLSTAAHFVAQSQSWLHGRFDVTGWPGHDLVTVGNKSYMVYPPMPALVMLPFVALLGAHFSDIWFTWLVAALNTVLLFRLLETLVMRGWSARSRRANAVLAITFSLGTIALWLAMGGTVWFTAQTLAITFTLLMMQGALSHRWWLASAALGALFLTRSPDLLGGLFLLVMVWRAEVRVASTAAHTAVPLSLFARGGNMLRSFRITGGMRTILAIGVPLGAALAIWLIRNQLYFGNLLSSGYDLQVKQDYPLIAHGLISWHYIWPNFVVDFLNFPSFSFATPFAVNPKVDLLRDGVGTSVFFTTPLMLLFFARQRTLAPQWLQRTLWSCIILSVGFSLVWNGTGWFQVGSRYLLDAYPYVFVLLAMWRARIDWRFLALVAAGVSINIALTQTFWCQPSQCLGASGSDRWFIFDMLLWSGPILAGAAWWWLRADQHHITAVPDPAYPPDAQDDTAHQASRPQASALA